MCYFLLDNISKGHICFVNYKISRSPEKKEKGLRVEIVEVVVWFFRIGSIPYSLSDNNFLKTQF